MSQSLKTNKLLKVICKFSTMKYNCDFYTECNNYSFAMLNCLHVVSALCTHGRCNSYAIWVNLVALQQKIYLLLFKVLQ